MINGKRSALVPHSFRSRETSNLKVTIWKIKYFGNEAGNISLIKM